MHASVSWYVIRCINIRNVGRSTLCEVQSHSRDWPTPPIASHLLSQRGLSLLNEHRSLRVGPQRARPTVYRDLSVRGAPKSTTAVRLHTYVLNLHLYELNRLLTERRRQ